MLVEKIYGDLDTCKFKAYFDVDCYFDYDIKYEDIINELKNKYFPNVKIHICFNFETKISAHIIAD